jgi:hypothetical protein
VSGDAALASAVAGEEASGRCRNRSKGDESVTRNSDKYTTIQPDELWHVYSDVAAIFRGGGGPTSPKLIGAKGPSARHLDIVYDSVECIELVVPNRAKGLSFSDSVERLQRLNIGGEVWMLPRGATLPRGLVFNYLEIDHPLLNAGVRMSVMEFSAKALVLAHQMVRTGIRIR